MSRVLIAEESSLLRDVLSLALRSEQSITVVGEAKSAIEAIELGRHHQPDVVVLDTTIANGYGTAKLISEIRDLADGRVVMLDAKPCESSASKAARSGAVAYISKTARLKRIVDAIHAVMNGTVWVDPTLPKDVREAFADSVTTVEPPPRLAALTPREIEVLSCVALGATNSEVAVQLSISNETVKTHMSNIFAKLGVQSRMAAAIQYHRFGNSAGPAHVHL